MTSRGVLFVHSAPSALCPHLEWAAGGVLGVRLSLTWTPQPVLPGTFRAEQPWQGPPGTGARLVSALHTWMHLRFEVTEEPGPGQEGARWSRTPALGVFHTATGVHGDILVGEDRLRAVVAAASASPRGEAAALRTAIDEVLGKRWDDELEPFRHAGESTPVRWLHQVV